MGGIRSLKLFVKPALLFPDIGDWGGVDRDTGLGHRPLRPAGLGLGLRLLRPPPPPPVMLLSALMARTLPSMSALMARTLPPMGDTRARISLRGEKLDAALGGVEEP